MAYLSKTERDALLDDLKGKSFNQIKGRLRRKFKAIRLAYYRNVQETDRWMTRFVLEDMGTTVTLVESLQQKGTKSEYTLQEIVVAPTEENRL